MILTQFRFWTHYLTRLYSFQHLIVACSKFLHFAFVHLHSYAAIHHDARDVRQWCTLRASRALRKIGKIIQYASSGTLLLPIGSPVSDISDAMFVRMQLFARFLGQNGMASDSQSVSKINHKMKALSGNTIQGPK
ncbi:hypothetical protein VNO77_00130 [Canavalia gladiata]|uniref:Uncharacterized protein n=1 Tax=Canavalia gladiata TaxID=3824 RepID=A0AAN9R129_CANGL